MKKFFLFHLIVLFPVSGIFAQTDTTLPENKNIGLFFSNLYDFSFQKADSVVLVLQRSGLEQTTLNNIRANLYWWKLLTGDSIIQNQERCNQILDESLSSLTKNRKSDTRSLVNTIYAYSLKARLENYNGHTLRSLPYFYNSMVYMNRCFELETTDENIKLISGLYLYFTEYIENEFFISGAIFYSFKRGDKMKGLRYLEECTASLNEMIRTEANYFLMKIYTGTEKNFPKALQYAQVLTEQHPDNIVYGIETLKILFTLKKTVEAQLMQSRLREEIQKTGNLNRVQKEHFLLQLTQLSVTDSKQ